MSTHLAWALSEYPPSDVGFVEEPFLVLRGWPNVPYTFGTRKDARQEAEYNERVHGIRVYVIRVRVTVEAA